MATFFTRSTLALSLFLFSGSFMGCELWFTTDCGPEGVRPVYNAAGSLGDGSLVYVADSGRILIEGGIHCSGWKILEVAGFPDLNDITFFDDPILGHYIVGDNGTLLRLTPDRDLEFLASPAGSADLNALSSGFPGDDLFAVGESGTVIKSTDEGLTWAPVTYPTFADLVDVDLRPDNSVFVSGEDYSFFRSTDGGASWDPTGPVMDGVSGSQSSYNRIYFYDNNLGFVGGPHGLILKSTDGGLSWESRSAQGFDEVTDLYFVTPDSGVAVGPGGVARFTTDGGENWFEDLDVTDYLNGRDVHRIFPIGRVFGTVLGDGLFSFVAPDSTYLDSTVTSVEQFYDLPVAFSLSQNYPNPFNPTTTFSFSVPQSSFINLTVYDLLGREIATIVNEERAPGTYADQWDATGHPSGVYFYRLETEEFVDAKKLVLLR